MVNIEHTVETQAAYGTRVVYILTDFLRAGSGGCLVPTALAKPAGKADAAAAPPPPPPAAAAEGAAPVGSLWGLCGVSGLVAAALFTAEVEGWRAAKACRASIASPAPAPAPVPAPALAPPSPLMGTKWRAERRPELGRNLPELGRNRAASSCG